MATIYGDDTNNKLNGTDQADTILGYGGDDMLLGNAGDDILSGGNGTDHLNGGAGADWLNGGDGLDYADYFGYTGPRLIVDMMNSSGNTGWAVGDTFVSIEGLSGSLQADSLYGNDALNFIYGLDGNDLLDGRGGNDYVYGGEGDDILIGGGGADELDGGDGIDTASYATAQAGVTVSLTDAPSNTGDAAGDTFISIENLIGSDHDDFLTGDDGENVIQGGEGHDTIDGRGGNDTMFGGDGHDHYVVTEAGDIVFEYMNQGWDMVWSNLDSYTLTSNVEGLSLIGYAVQGVGNDLDNSIYGNSQNNVLIGGGGNDRLFGGFGADILDGGTGSDTAHYTSSSATNPATEAGLVVDLFDASSNTGDAAGDTFVSIENLVGSLFNDSLRGDNGHNVLDGLSGNDLLYGREGNDTLYGNHGNDYLDGGAGNDWMEGGTGDDTYIVAAALDQTVEYAGEGTDTVRSYIDWMLAGNVERLELQGSSNLNGTGNSLNNTLVGNSGNNLLNGGAGNDYMVGGAGNDVYVVAAAGDKTIEMADGGTDTVRSYIDWMLSDNVERLELQGSSNLKGTGNTLNNTLVGNSGNNSLNGGDGNDWIVGGAGNDTLTGGVGNDTLIGGAGNDILNGGAGNDRFDFDLVSDSPAGPALRDSIVGGFSHGFDLIDLATIDANTLAAGNQAFSFIGSAAFSGVAGQLRYTNYSGNVIIDADVNGDSVADMQILVAGTNFMTGTDFIL
jgi:Ca2+-binding RTX toxin-like protein